MKASQVVALLTNRVPDSETWSHGETYGAFNVNPDADVKRVMFCVTATKEVVERFGAGGYDLLVSHHPFLVPGIPQVVLHTALDCCAGGLNDMWAEHLSIKERKHFDQNLGWYGEIEECTIEELAAKVKALSGGVIGQVYSSQDKIKSVVVCSGLGGIVIKEALESGADCYIVGELVQQAKTTGFKSVIEIGHTLSEWIGVKLIKSILEPHGIAVDYAGLDADRFGREHYPVR